MVRAIERPAHLLAVRRNLRAQPVTLLLGPRQAGKTTLARMIVAEWRRPVTCFDLEDPADRARLGEPMRELRPLEGLVVIDEVQHVKGLFEVLRVLADRRPVRTRFLLLGSASFDLVRQGSETLAGRVALHELEGFDLSEVGGERLDRLWLRGGLPRSYCARSVAESAVWRRDFIQTFLQRDLQLFGSAMAPMGMRRFWTMLAHWHGQVWNGSEFGRAFGVSHTTVRKYLDLLTGTYMVRQLPPWFENLGKRLVKSPKIYIRDSGILHTLLGLERMNDLLSHPKVGASWEGALLAAVIRRLRARDEECFFFGTHGGAELDLLVVRGGRRLGFEFKRTEEPRPTRSTRTCLKDLKLDQLAIVHAGRDSFDLGDRLRAVASSRLLDDLAPLA